MSNVSTRTNTLAKLGILAAISVVLVAIVHFPLIPAASFLEYDPADVPSCWAPLRSDRPQACC